MSDEQGPSPVDNDPITIAARYIVDGDWITRDGDLLLDGEHHSDEAFYGGLQQRLEEVGYHGYSRQFLSQAKLEAHLMIINAEIEKQDRSQWRAFASRLGHLPTTLLRRRTRDQTI